MKYAVVFDMDGIIFDTENVLWKIWKAIAEKYDMEHIEDFLKECLGLTVEETSNVFKRHYGNQFDYYELKKEASEIFKKEEEKGLPIKKGARELLSYLKEHNYKVALASSTRIEAVKRELGAAGLDQYFQEIIGGDMVEHSKPHPEIYELACKKLQVNPAETLGIEDSFNGLRAAYAAGLKPIMVPDILQPDEAIQKLLFKKCNSLLDVKDFFMEQD